MIILIYLNIYLYIIACLKNRKIKPFSRISFENQFIFSRKRFPNRSKTIWNDSGPGRNLTKAPFDSIRYPATVQADDDLACTTALRGFQFDWSVLEHYLLHYGLKNVLRKT